MGCGMAKEIILPSLHQDVEEGPTISETGSIERIKELWAQSGDDDVLRAYQDIEGCRPEARPIVREEAIRRELIHVDDSGELVTTEKGRDVQFEIDQRTARVILLKITSRGVLLKIGKTIAVFLIGAFWIELLQESTGRTLSPAASYAIIMPGIYAIWRKSKPAPPPKEDTIIRRKHHKGPQGDQE
jgi:hypothetical protein